MGEKHQFSLSRESCYILFSSVVPTCGQGTLKSLSGKVDTVVEAIIREKTLQKLPGPANLLAYETPGLQPT